MISITTQKLKPSYLDLNSKPDEVSPDLRIDSPNQSSPSQNRATLYSRHAPSETVNIFSDIVRIYADLDGTCLPMGETKFPQSFLDKLRLLRRNGCHATFITGKPLSEVATLISNVPLDIPLEIIIEKGAYTVRRDEMGQLYRDDLLINDTVKSEITTLRTAFQACRAKVESKFGVCVRPAGDGGHQTALSIDILDPSLIGAQNKTREEMKVKDGILLQKIKNCFEEWLLEQHLQGWEVVDIGNANFEISYQGINKGLALQTLEQAREANGSILIVGDSGNDMPMLKLRDEASYTSGIFNKQSLEPVCLQKPLYNGVIQHTATPHTVTDIADFIVHGEARADVLLQKIIEAKGIVQHLLIASNTSPLSRVGDTIEIRVGMPVALADLMKNLDSCKWIYVGDETYPGHTLSGKLIATPISEEERQAHYLDISNGLFWPVAHLPQSKAPIMKYNERAWNLYAEVCAKVARQVNLQIESHYLANPDSIERPTVWVQDYQMLAVAEALQSLRPAQDYKLGLYWHIPFPEPEIFLQELGREKALQVIKWLSAYNVLGFHTTEYAQNYQDICKALKIIPAKIVVQPISVNVQDIEQATRDILQHGHDFKEPGLNEFFKVANLQSETRRQTEFVLCGMERSDDTKACVERLEAWKILALQSPELFTDKSILEVVVPSRQDIPHYRELYTRVVNLIKEINDILGREVIVHKAKLGREDAIAAMVLSDTVVITARRDGFNMSAAEAAVVQKTKATGRLLVSDQIGFYTSLKDQGLAQAVNVIQTGREGITVKEIAQALKAMLTGKAELPHERFEMLQKYFQVYTLQTWAQANINAIIQCGAENEIVQIG